MAGVDCSCRLEGLGSSSDSDEYHDASTGLEPWWGSPDAPSSSTTHDEQPPTSRSRAGTLVARKSLDDGLYLQLRLSLPFVFAN